MGKIAKPLVFLIVFFMMGAGFAAVKSERLAPASGEAQITAGELFRRIADSSNQIKDLSAQVDFNLQLLSFGLTFNVSGNYYYKQPDKVMIKFAYLPEFLASRQREVAKHADMMADSLKNPMQNFDARVLAETPGFGGRCYLVELVPKSKQNVTKIFLWVNSADYTIPQTITEFDDGSNITQRKTYTESGRLRVISKTETDIDSPEVQAQVTTLFKNCQINQGIPDTVFDASKHFNCVSCKL